MDIQILNVEYTAVYALKATVYIEFFFIILLRDWLLVNSHGSSVIKAPVTDWVSSF